MPTIALVDDDRNILTSVSIALEGEGYRVHIDNVVFPGDTDSDKEFGPSRVGHPEHITGRTLEFPIYPIVLQMHGVEGTVLLAILIDPDGRVEQVTAMQSMLFDARGSDLPPGAVARLVGQAHGVK